MSIEFRYETFNLEPEFAKIFKKNFELFNQADIPEKKNLPDKIYVLLINTGERGGKVISPNSIAVSIPTKKDAKNSLNIFLHEIAHLLFYGEFEHGSREEEEKVKYYEKKWLEKT